MLGNPAIQEEFILQKQSDSEKPSGGEVSADLKPERQLTQLKKSRAKSKKMLLLLYIAFILGLLYGAILIREDIHTFFDNMSMINETNITQRQTQPLFATFLQAFTSSTVFFTVIFLMGFSAIAQPMTFAVIFIKGLGIGSSVGYMYINYSVTGLLYSVLIILVPTVIGTLSLIMLAKESMKLSNMIFMGFAKNTCKISRYTLKLYLYKSAVFYALILLASVVDAVMTFLFLGLFKF